MTYEQLISHFGTQQKAADALGIGQSAVAQWAKSEIRPNARIPQGRQYQIQLLTGGVLQADVLEKRAA